MPDDSADASLRYEEITLAVPRATGEDPVASWDWQQLTGALQPVNVVPRLSVEPAGAFALDRGALTEYMQRELDMTLVIEDRALDDEIAERVNHAREGGAISGPENVEVAAYADGEGVIVAVREEKVDPDSYAYRRQIATHAIDPRFLIDRERTGDVEEVFAAIEECLRRAGELVRGLRLLQAAEAVAPACGPDAAAGS